MTERTHTHTHTHIKFSCLVTSDPLQPHGLQHVRPPCPSPTPRACSNSCPSSQRWHPTILSSVIPFYCFQSFPASGYFPIGQSSTLGGQYIGVSTSTSALQMNIQDWFPLGLTSLISLQSKELSKVFSNTTVETSILQHSDIFMFQLSHPYMTTGKTIALARQIFCWQSNVSAF